MAAMDYRRARALAEQLIMAGQDDGLPREALVEQIIAKSKGAGAPGTAIGATMMPVPPREVTPATPAPMQPGVQLVAPKPTAQEMPVAEVPQRAAARPSRYQPELDRVRANLGVAQKAMSDAVAGGQKPNYADQIRLGTLQQQADRLDALVRAEGSPEAEIPEEMRAAFEGRQARLARRDELLAQAKARSPFEALIAGGAAMAQGRRGESFGEALARGLQTGIMDYGRARRAGEEGAESVAEARDQAMIDRYNMQEKASEAAVQRARDIVGMGRAAREEAVADVRLPTQLRGEEAKTALAEFNVSDAPVEAASVRGLRADQGAYYRGEGRQPAGRGGSSKGMTENQRLTKIQQLQRDLRKYRAQLGGAYMRDQKQAIQVNINDIMRQLAELQGATPAATAGTPKPSFQYTPGKGLQPFN